MVEPAIGRSTFVTDPGDASPGAGLRVAPDWAWLLDGLEVQRLRFRLEPSRPFVPPPFPGSMFRGALGHALRDLACVRAHQDCPRCDLFASCAYPRLFDVHRGGPGGRGEGPERRPPPFVLEWTPGLGGGEIRSAYDLDVLLCGAAAAWKTLLVPAVTRAAEGGLGGVRVPHRMLGVETVQGDGTSTAANDRTEPLHAHARIPAGDGPLVLRVLTPLRLRETGVHATRLGFETLVRAALRRMRLLATTYGTTSPPWIEDAFLAGARQVRTTASSLRWYDWTRHSSRQGVSMPLGGLVGDVTYEGPWAPFAPLLAAAAVLHVGKGAPFGLGHMERVTRQDTTGRFADS